MNRNIFDHKIKIVLMDDYPKSIPQIWETGGKIPRIPDRHINPTDGSLCLGVSEDLYIKYKGNFNIKDFLEGPTYSFFVGNALIEKGESWPHGEWDHALSGILQYYLQFFETDSSWVVIQLLMQTMRPLHNKNLCACNSGKTVGNCHGKVLRKLQRYVPKDLVQKNLTALIKNYGNYGS